MQNSPSHRSIHDTHVADVSATHHTFFSKSISCVDIATNTTPAGEICTAVAADPWKMQVGRSVASAAELGVHNTCTCTSYVQGTMYDVRCTYL